MTVIKKLLMALIPLILFSVIAMFLAKGLKQNPHKVPSPFIGKQFPIFSAASLEAPEHRLTNKLFQGHVSLLNVFASWCLYCRSEHPVLMDIKDNHQLIIYGLDYKDKRIAAIAWLKNYGDPYTKVIFDPQGKLAVNLGVYGTPETFIIDEDGVIRYKYVGPISPTLWKDTLLPKVVQLEREKS